MDYLTINTPDGLAIAHKQGPGEWLISCPVGDQILYTTLAQLKTAVRQRFRQDHAEGQSHGHD